MIRVTSTALNAGGRGPLSPAARCIRSVRAQTLRTWTHHYFDAASEDDTWRWVEHHAKHDKRVRAYHNNTRRDALENLLPLWRSFDDDDIVVWLDGDDWLAVDGALEVVARVHAAGALATYGQFVWPDGQLGFAAPVGPDPRHELWRATHLKTFRAGLVKRIREEDFHSADGSWFLPRDRAVMYPVLEMAAERAIFVPSVLYAYNAAHSHEANEPDQSRVHAHVRELQARPSYGRIDW